MARLIARLAIGAAVAGALVCADGARAGQDGIDALVRRHYGLRLMAPLRPGQDALAPGMLIAGVVADDGPVNLAPADVCAEGPADNRAGQRSGTLSATVPNASPRARAELAALAGLALDDTQGIASVRVTFDNVRILGAPRNVVMERARVAAEAAPAACAAAKLVVRSVASGDVTIELSQAAGTGEAEWQALRNRIAAGLARGGAKVVAQGERLTAAGVQFAIAVGPR